MIRALPFLLSLALPACAQTFTWEARNTDFPPAFAQQFRAPLEVTAQPQTRILTDGLAHPWGIAVLPDSAGYLVTERTGQLRHIALDGTLSAPIRGIPRVVAERQGGLLDVAVDPDFARTRAIYLTYAKPNGAGSSTAAARMVLAADHSSVSNVRDIFVQNRPTPVPVHFGSRIVFLSDGTLAVTTGDRGSVENRRLSQDLGVTYGKVIRVNPDGSVPANNPFVGRSGAVDSIWSYGHRNMQGAAVGPDGTLWTIEHGPRGGDELNAPRPGRNYGWPVISYGENYNGTEVGQGLAVQDGMEQPVYFWDPVIAPGGMMFHSGAAFGAWNGDLLIGSLNPGGVVRLEIERGRVVAEERLLMDQGRVRDVEVLEDGSFLILVDSDPGAVVHVTPAGSSG